MKQETSLIKYVVELLDPYSGIVALILSLLYLAALARTVRPTGIQKGSMVVLSYGWPVKMTGCLALIVGGSIAFVAFHSAACRSTFSNAVGAVLMGIAFGAMGGYCMLETFFVRIAFDDHFIYVVSPWRKSRQIPWEDVLTYGFSYVNQWYVLETRNGEKIRVSRYLSGVDSFLEQLRKRIRLDDDSDDGEMSCQ